MHHLIVGYGYCGYYIAQELIKNGQQVTTISRHLNPNYQLPSVTHRIQNVTDALFLQDEDTCLYYLIPPPNQSNLDTLLSQFLQHAPRSIKKVIYFGSSGVYGNHQGQLIDEDAECRIQYPRQLSRLNAEEQWRSYCRQRAIDLVLLRIGGIYGPNRLPSTAAQENTPIIFPQQAPLINSIYVRDLARIAFLLASNTSTDEVFNTADGKPQPMGTIQGLVAQKLGLPTTYETWEEAWSKASPMKKEFLQGSKQLNITRLVHQLPSSFCFTTLEEAVTESLYLQSLRG